MASLETLEKYKSQNNSSVGALTSAKTDNPNLPADPYNTVQANAKIKANENSRFASSSKIIRKQKE